MYVVVAVAVAVAAVSVVGEMSPCIVAACKLERREGERRRASGADNITLVVSHS